MGFIVKEVCVTKYLLIVFFCLFSINSYAEKVLLIGDSLMGTISESYKKHNKKNEVNIKYVVGSGLENKNFDWFNYLSKRDLSSFNKVIISFGTNDFGVHNKNSYEKKVKSFIKLIKEKQPTIKIIWIAPPAVKSKNINNGIISVRNIINDVSEQEKIDFMDVRDILGYDFKQYIQGKKVRENDGIHYTSNAGDMIVSKIQD